MDASTSRDDEGRDSLRKASVRWQVTCDPEMSEWGNPALVTESELILNT